MNSKLSIIICTYNRAKSLSECLKSLIKQNYSNFEVVIVDGGSTDKTNRIITEYTKRLTLKKILYPEKELAKTRDRGWREAKGEIVSFIDDDVTVSPDWAKSLVELFDGNTGVGGVSGPTIVKPELLKERDIFLFYNSKGFTELLGKFWNQFFLEGQKPAVGKIFKSGAWLPGSNFESCLEIKGLRDVDYLEACNMSLRRKLIQKVNGFDYGFRGTAEWCEPDLAIRVKKLGHRLVFSSKVRLDHNISQKGVYPRRVAAKVRMENFFRFYFRHIFKFRVDYLFKFLAYVLFLNIYWAYKTITTKNIGWLGGWLGTISGFWNLKHKKQN